MNILNGVKILDTLSDSEKEKLSMFCQMKKIKSGEVLFREGDEATAMYILSKGQFKVYQENCGKKISLGLIDAEEVLGEMALFSCNSKRMATAIATEDSELITILSFSVKELVTKNPLILEKIKTIINEREIDNKISKAIN